jgi:hypothetical protein
MDLLAMACGVRRNDANGDCPVTVTARVSRPGATAS